MKRSAKRILIGIVAIGLCAGGWKLLIAPMLPSHLTGAHADSSAIDRIKLYTVARGPMHIGITDDGKIRAAKNYLIYGQAKGQLKITWIAPEGSTVKKGDPVARFDKKDFETLLNTQAGELAVNERQLEMNKEAVKIQESTGRSAVAVAETKMGDAEVALRTYRNLEAPKLLNTIEKEKLEAHNKLDEAKKNVDDIHDKLDAELFEEQQRAALEQELLTDMQTVATIQGTIDGLIQQRRIFRSYDYPQNIDAKQKAYENSKLEVEKARVEADSALNQKRAEVAKVQGQIDRLNAQVADLKDQIAKCELIAPADGLVLYGNTETEAYYNRGDQIQAGASWYSGNVLMTIPDSSGFLIDMQIAEEYRGRIATGAVGSITINAVPGLVIKGVLTEIASLAKPRLGYDSSSPKVFAAKVKPDVSDPRIVSGMTARIELVTDELADVMNVPVESVFNIDGKTICYVQTPTGPDRREVKTGKSNDQSVEIIDGLKVGEKVFTANPIDRPGER